jgi:hypothetical protein
MNVKTLILATALAAFAGSAMAANKPVPTPPVKPAASAPAKADKKPLGEACKMVKGKKKCHKSPYKSKMDVKPYQGKPKAAKKN